MKITRPHVASRWNSQRLIRQVISVSFTLCVFQVLCPHGEARDYEIPELLGTISVSDRWFPIDKEIVEEWNDELSRRRANNPSLYLAGFTKGAKATRHKSGKPADPARLNTEQYIWVMYVRGTISSPDSVVAYVRQLRTISGKNISKDPVAGDRVKSMDLKKDPYWDAKLSACVIEMNAEAPDGYRAPIRAYLFPLRTGLINVIIYSTKEKGREDFEQAQEIVSTLRLRDEDGLKLSPAWYAQLAKAFESK